MKRFFVDKLDDPVVLCGDEHKHLSVVLRAKAGETVVLCSGDGYDNIYKIGEIGKSTTRLSFCERVKNESEPSVGVTLFPSVMKGDKNDFVVQKAVELGVNEIYPMFTRFVQAHEKSVRVDRLNKIALEAAKQCGRSVLTKVYAPINFGEMLEKVKSYDLVVFPYEKASGMSLKYYLGEVLDKRKEIGNVAVIIGSEGGFADEEAEALSACGVMPVTLGKRILRAETANIAVLSAVMYELGQWQ